jgi:hypothetical protein
LTHYAVFPAFFDLLRTFGNKTWEAEENFGIYRQHLQDDANAATSCFRNSPSLKRFVKMLVTENPLFRDML